VFALAPTEEVIPESLVSKDWMPADTALPPLDEKRAGVRERLPGEDPEDHRRHLTKAARLAGETAPSSTPDRRSHSPSRAMFKQQQKEKAA